MKLPGTRLLALAERWLDPALVRTAVVPAVADLQHEVNAAGTSRMRRVLARARGWAAVARIVFIQGFHESSPMRRLAAVLLLGAAGSVLVMTVASVRGGPARFSPFLVMVGLAPATLRLLRAGRSYRQMFVNCAGVGLLMVAALWMSLALEGRTAVPWYAQLLLWVFMTGCVALVSMVAAAVAWQPGAASEPRYRRRLRQAGAATAAFAASYLLLGLWFGYARGPLAVLDTLGWVMILGLLFSAIALVAYLPVLLAVRRFVADAGAALWLPVAGALLFPIPLLVFPFLQGRLASTGVYLLNHPADLFWASLPYLAGGAALGWLLARQPAPGGPRVDPTGPAGTPETW